MATDDGYTKLLLHCDGADESTTFTDEAGHTVNPVGTAQVDTAIKKFGTGACLMDGNSDWLSIPTSDDWDVADGDFSIDFWFYPASAANAGLFYFSSDTHYALGMTYHYLNANKLNLWASANGTSWNLITSDTAQGKGVNALTTAAWNHIALSRSGNQWSAWVNGVLDINITAAGTVIDKNEAILIGAWTGTTFPTNGSIDEFRYAKGIARWKSGITVPTGAYPTSVTNYLKHSRRNRFQTAGVSLG
jgi:hypothetical protein